jgi:hypothetical protein
VLYETRLVSPPCFVFFSLQHDQSSLHPLRTAFDGAEERNFPQRCHMSGVIVVAQPLPPTIAFGDEHADAHDIGARPAQEAQRGDRAAPGGDEPGPNVRLGPPPS